MEMTRLKRKKLSMKKLPNKLLYLQKKRLKKQPLPTIKSRKKIS
jgi:hypothetical protein